ncbi:MAG: hypothetical protein Tsb0021_03930 [Chlamydiales bacterium]
MVSFWKWGGGILFVAICVLFAPQTILAPIIKPMIEKQLAAKLPHSTVKIKDIELSWFKGQILRKIAVNHPDYSLEAEEICFEEPIWRLSSSPRNFIVSLSSKTIEGGEGFLKAMISLNKPHPKIKIDAQKFPTSVLDNLLEVKHPVFSLMGPDISLALLVYEGKISINTESEHLQVDCKHSQEVSECSLGFSEEIAKKINHFFNEQKFFSEQDWTLLQSNITKNPHYPQGSVGHIKFMSPYGWVNGKQFDFTGDFHRGGFSVFDPGTYRFQLELKQVPSILFNTFFSDLDISRLIGSYCDLKISTLIDAKYGKNSIVDWEVNANQFRLAGDVQITPDGIHLCHPRRPIYCDWTLTPERFAYLQNTLGNSCLDLKNPVGLFISLSEFYMPWDQPQRLAGNVSITFQEATLLDKHENISAHLKRNELKIATHNLSESLTCNALFEGVLQGTKVEPCSTKGHIVISKPLENSHFQRIQAELLFLRAPLSILAKMFCLDTSIQQQADIIIGSKLDGTARLSFSEGVGSVEAHLRGTNSKVFLDGYIKDGILRLNRTFFAEMAVTQELSKSLIQDIFPLFNAALSAEHPITLKIEPQGFALPLFYNSLSNLVVGNATLDLGKIEFGIKNQLEQILNLLNLADEKNKKINIWFTPMYFSISQGVIQCKRTDMLIALRYPLALWGKIDYVKDKVKMTLGVPGTTLSKALGLKKIPPEAILQLPIKGSLSETKIDTKKAKAKIGSIIAHGKGGPEGLLIGNLFDIITGNLNESKPPYPTTHPFPWDKS